MSKSSIHGIKGSKGAIRLTIGFILLGLFVFIYGCGGGSGESASNPTTQGVFFDSPVGGISYGTETHSGTTDENGVFFYPK